MKIVDREAFLKLPAGTVYQTYEPCIFGHLCIKGNSLLGKDWYTVDTSCCVECLSYDEMPDILEKAFRDGSSVDLDLDIESRDGMYNLDQLFAVWEAKDVSALIERLKGTP